MHFRCTSVSPGYVQGRVELLDGTEDASRDRVQGAIAVIRRLSPDIVLLLVKGALGVIAESGGIASHGAILARQAGLPCAVLRDARRLLDQGNIVRLNANKGIVEVVE